MANEPTTVTMNVSLPEPLKRYVDTKVASGIYGSASEFVREAIREKYQREQSQGTLSSKLLEGLDSGRPVELTDDHFAGKKSALAERFRGKSGKP
jgi:antitoxin ParD1/3/4